MLTEVKRGNITSEIVDFVLETCCNCGIPFFMPAYHQKRLLANKGESFYCPNGHSQHYVGQTEADKLKKELQSLKDSSSKKEEELQNKWLDELGRANKLDRQLKRVHKGVCPCCKRSFQNLKRHMATKHPDITTKMA